MDPSPPTPAPVPNHHADHPPFAGSSGLLAAISMLTGRRDDSRLASELVGLVPSDHVVDIGCGPGAAAREAVRRGASVTGVDPAPVMLAVARRATRRSAPIEWRLGSAESLPVADGSATVVWSLAAVHHWADIDAGLAECSRVLAPGGRLLVVERRVPAGASGLAGHGWTSAQADVFAAACSDAGLIDLSVEVHPGGRGPALVVRADVPQP